MRRTSPSKTPRKQLSDDELDFYALDELSPLPSVEDGPIPGEILERCSMVEFLPPVTPPTGNMGILPPVAMSSASYTPLRIPSPYVASYQHPMTFASPMMSHSTTMFPMGYSHPTPSSSSASASHPSLQPPTNQQQDPHKFSSCTSNAANFPSVPCLDQSESSHFSDAEPLYEPLDAVHSVWEGSNDWGLDFLVARGHTPPPTR